MTNTPKKSAGKFIVGTTIVAAAAAGIVSFFTQTAKGKKMWKESMEHTTALMKLIAKKADTIKNLTQASYERLVDEVMDEYQQHRDLTVETSKELGSALKKEWRTLKKGVTRSTKKKA